MGSTPPDHPSADGRSDDAIAQPEAAAPPAASAEGDAPRGADGAAERQPPETAQAGPVPAAAGRDGDEGGAPLLDEVDVRDLLRDALQVPPDQSLPAVRGAVQRAIRQRSRGRFYADAWGTSSAPRATFLVTSLLILALVIAAWFLLSPSGYQLFSK